MLPSGLAQLSCACNSSADGEALLLSFHWTTQYVQASGLETILQEDTPPTLVHYRSSDNLLCAWASGIVVLSPEFVCRKWPMKELRIFAQRKERHPAEQFMLLPIFLRLRADDISDKSQVADLYQTDKYQKLLGGNQPEQDWVDLVAQTSKSVGIRPDQVKAVPVSCSK